MSHPRIKVKVKQRREARITSGRVAGQVCPSCESLLDGLTGVGIDDAAREPLLPDEGAISACVYCGALLRFDAQLRMHLVPDGEREAVLDGLEPMLRKVIENAIARVKRPRLAWPARPQK